uniref:Uncharacterized protein n=1 Tax=Cyanistes caeruleus TaxID=156563 RepID=A0A8C0ZJZ5_CYACU
MKPTQLRKVITPNHVLEKDKLAWQSSANAKGLSPLTQRPKPRITIPSGHIKPGRILHPLVRLGLQLKIRPNRGTTSRRPDHLLRSHPGNHPPICHHSQRELHPEHPSNHSRASLPHFLLLTPRYNMIRLHTSRNKSCPIRPNRRRI